MPPRPGKTAGPRRLKQTIPSIAWRVQHAACRRGTASRARPRQLRPLLSGDLCITSARRRTEPRHAKRSVAKPPTEYASSRSQGFEPKVLHQGVVITRAVLASEAFDGEEETLAIPPGFPTVEQTILSGKALVIPVIKVA